MSRFFLLLLLAPPLGASPNDDQKHPEEIALVRKLYEEARSGNGGEILVKYADRSLKEAFAAEARFHESTDSICIDADPVWESQDPITDVKVEVRALRNGKIRASFEQYGRVDIDYTVNCAGGRCRISDLETDGDHGLKDKMLHCE